MKADLNRWNIIINGSWNTAIFSPQWTGKRFKDLFDVQQLQFEVLADHSGTHVRYASDDIVVVPASQRLLIGFKNDQEATARNVERMAQAILQDLPHTPVTAFGINFGFIQEDPPQGFLKLFDLADQARLTGYLIQSTSIARAIKVGSAVLNAKFTLEHTPNRVTIELNFHHECDAAPKAVGLLNGDRVLDLRNQAMELLEKVYGLPIKEEAQ